MPRPRRASRRRRLPAAPVWRRLPAAPVWLAPLLLVLAVASVGVGGSGLERAGSILQVASGPAATPGGGSVSQAGDGAARLDAAVLGRAPAEARAQGSSAKRSGERGSDALSGEAGAGQSSGTPAQPSSGTETGAGADPSGSGAGTGPPSGGGLGDTVDDTAGGVTDQVPDLPKPLPGPGDVVDGILDDPKLPGGLDKPDRLAP